MDKQSQATRLTELLDSKDPDKVKEAQQKLKELGYVFPAKPNKPLDQFTSSKK
jgi:hypothetical protein